MTNPISSIASAATGAVKAAAAPEADKLKKVAQQFEAVFLRQMIGTMRSASLGDGILDSSATEQFQSMSDAKMADVMSGQGVLHVADLLVKQLGARMNLKGAAASGASAATGATAADTAAAPAAGDGQTK